MSLVKSIQDAVDAAWAHGGRVHITFVTRISGNLVGRNFFPSGFENDIGNTGIKSCTISIGVQACKSFGYNAETNTFDYEVGVAGKPFYGTIAPESVMWVVNPDEHKQFGVWTPFIDDSNMVTPIGSKPPTRTIKKLELSCVSYNPDITPSNSKAILKVVGND